MITKLLLSTVLLGTIVLTGCGGSGSSSSSPDANAKTIIQVANQSPFDFASVTIQDRNGGTLYESPFKCASQDTNCYINLNQDYNESVTLLFKEASGKLVRAVIVANSPKTYISLYPDAFSTGFYMVNRIANDLAASNGIGWEELNLRIGTFFANYDSPDGTVDPYQEIGLYYTSQLAKGVASEEVFLTEFKQRLLNWDIALNDELPVAGANVASFYQRLYAYLKSDHNPFIQPAFAAGSSCGEGLQGFLTITENLASIIPIVGDGIAGVAGIGSSYCDGTDAKLDQIMSQLNELQDSVNVVDRNLGQMTKFLTDQAANQKTMDFQKLADQAKNLNAVYKRFMLDNNVKTLGEFFVKKGGWKQAIDSGGDVLKAILIAPYEDISKGGLYTKTLGTTQYADFNTYLEALKTRCRSLPTSSDENFIITRQQCNNIILSNSGMLVATQGLTLPIYKDVYATLNAYNEQAKNTYLLPDGLTSFATAYTQIKDSFTKQQSEMVKDYKAKIGTTGYFNAFDGLNQGIIDSLVNRECMQTGRDRANGPAIVGWYAPNTNEKANYIETKCKVGTASKRIKARYNYNDQGSVVNANDVANVLGVPVAYGYVKTGYPLYQDFVNNATRDENVDNKAIVEVAQGIMLGSGDGSPNGVISESIYKMSNGLYYDIPQNISVWAVIPPSDEKSNAHAARVRIGVYYSNKVMYGIACVASPCRADPRTREWLVFTDDNKTLDLWNTNTAAGERPILRLAPVGQ